jgi:hypothetical protein
MNSRLKHYGTPVSHHFFPIVHIFSTSYSQTPSNLCSSLVYNMLHSKRLLQSTEITVGPSLLQLWFSVVYRLHRNRRVEYILRSSRALFSGKEATVIVAGLSAARERGGGGGDRRWISDSCFCFVQCDKQNVSRLNRSFLRLALPQSALIVKRHFSSNNIYLPYAAYVTPSPQTK